MKDKVRIGHVLQGQGPQKIIALHDWMGNHDNWKMMHPFIDHKTYTYAFMDVRGYGRSKGLKARFNLNEIVADIFSLADDLGWRQFHLLGHSMTGLVAQKVIISDQCKRILGLIVIAPVPAHGFPIDSDTAAFFKNIITDSTTAAMAYGAFTSQRLSQNWARQRVQNLHKNTNPTAMLAYLQMWSQANFLEELEGNLKDLMIVYGDQDHPGFQKEAITKGFGHFPNAQFVEIKNAGHYPMQEVPIYTATIIEKYLSEHALQIE